MKKLFFIGAAILVLGLALPTMAQQEDACNVYGGYYFVHASVNASSSYSGLVGVSRSREATDGDPSFSYNFNGGGGQVACNFNQDSKIKFGIVADFAGLHWAGSGTSANMFSYLFGPRVTYGDGKLSPFVQVLFGGARISGSNFFGGGSENAFAMTAGGGLDYQLTRHWFVRPVEAEYFLTDFSGFGITGHQNNFRYSAGVGFRWP